MDIVCIIGDKVTGAIGGTIFKQVEDYLAVGAAQAIRLSVAGWVGFPTPDIDSTTSGVAYLTAYTKPITYVIFVVALLIQAAHLAWSQRGEEFRELAKNLMQFVVIAFGGAAAVALLTQAGDIYANWILNASTTGAPGQTMGDRIIALLGMAAGPSGGLALPIAGPLAMLLCLFVCIAGLAQVLMIYARSIVVILLVGLLPLAAAAAMTRAGRSMLNRYLAWLLAWTLFKPVAAMIYAGAFFMLGSGGALSFIAGMGAIIMAAFALPALMRLLVPAVSSMGGGGGTGMEGALGAAGMVATGAMQMAGGAASKSSDSAADPGSMTVRDATHGSRPTGSVPPSAGGASGGAQAAGAASQTAGGAGAAGGAAAAGGGSAAAGAAAGPWGMAAAVGAQVASKAATAPARAAQSVAGEATGSGGER